MTRISKAPEERRSELIDVAQELFLKKGYQQTSIQDIVKTVGVAQGTFYYYFKTKEDVLEAVLYRHVHTIFSETVEKSFQLVLSAPEKIQRLLEITLRGIHKFAVFHEVFLKEEYFTHFQRVQKMGLELHRPYLVKVFEQGCREGLMNIPDREKTVDFLFEMNVCLLNALVDPKKKKDWAQWLQTALTIIERVTGMKEGTLKPFEISLV